MGNRDVADFFKEESPLFEGYIEQFLEDNGILRLNKREGLIETAKLVREIPFGDGRTVEEVLVKKGKGTCTGKHLVLQRCLQRLGYDTQQVVTTYLWGDQGVRYPSHLQSILDEGEWEHGHNFVRFRDKYNGWIDLDVNWDKALVKYGFPSLSNGWNGATSFVAAKLVRRWDNVSSEEMKKRKVELIESLTPEVRDRRDRFLTAFLEWADYLHK